MENRNYIPELNKLFDSGVSVNKLQFLDYFASKGPNPQSFNCMSRVVVQAPEELMPTIVRLFETNTVSPNDWNTIKLYLKPFVYRKDYINGFTNQLVKFLQTGDNLELTTPLQKIFKIIFS